MSSKPHDPVFAAAIEQWRAVRAEFEDYRLSQYTAAEEACRGAMLNPLGRRLGKDAYDLFIGNMATANAYASAELREWWRENGRTDFATYASQRVDLYA
jgi:hypothetical protein